MKNGRVLGGKSVLVYLQNLLTYTLVKPTSAMQFGLFFIKICCFGLLAWTLLPLKVQAQNLPAQSWEKEFEGRNYYFERRDSEIPNLMIPADGGFLLGGITRENFRYENRNELLLIKLDAQGNQLWKHTYGGKDDEYFTTLQPTPDGNYLIGGTSSSSKSGNKSQDSNGSDFWLVKVNKNGAKIWDKSIGGKGNESLRDLIQTADGGFILGGVSSSDVGGDRSQPLVSYNDYWLIKLDSAGNKQWDRNFGSNIDRMKPYLVNITSDGGFILSCSVKMPNSFNNYDLSILKLDANGNKVWEKTYGGNKYEGLNFLRQTPDGGSLLASYSDSEKSGDKSTGFKGNSDIWLLKLDAGGNKLWDRTLGGSGYDYVNSLEPTPDGGFVVLGKSCHTRLGGKVWVSGRCGSKRQERREIDYGKGYWVAKFNAQGSREWEKVFGLRNKWLNSMQLTADGDYIFLGNLKNNGRNRDDLYLISLNAKGKKWRQEKVETGFHIPSYSYSMRLTPDGNYIVEGRDGIGSDFPTDYMVIKYTSPKKRK